MVVNYLGPLVAGIDHPALRGYDVNQFAPSCYLVEIGEEAGVDGPLIEGDVLVVDEARTAQHDDLVIVDCDEEQRLYQAFRLGGSLLLIPPRDRSGSIRARQNMLRGVVVSQARRYGW
ncbi:hypothetical protein SAMN05661010_00060 [Modicisalibacter muralis]|uniref:Peptidase S24/S26A/S26B/S26C domain-containing protein n=1 Tax=Modicisalibacter muralis TaxID=119000 RepID=A0A1G9EQ24_9GAMM|nr:hypothetical protein [Halomonas muralis]SDK78115.1 hypothetical protein SAMN05661010_00060 [Halomonas muralis]